MIDEWAPILKEDALHLLSANFSCSPYYAQIDSDVILYIRNYAVGRLQTCTDEELHSILLQLVQALRYEDTNASPLFELLVERSLNCDKIAISLYWFLTVEVATKSGKVTLTYSHLFEQFFAKIKDLKVYDVICQ
jgi:hypothetical protein